MQQFNQQPTNYNPPTELDPIVYFGDDTSIDTTANIMTLLSGTQIDITTGQVLTSARSSTLPTAPISTPGRTS